MELNFQKMVTRTFTNKKEPLQFRYGNPDHTLGNVQEFKYLGVVFPPNLKWHKYIDLISAKSLKKLGYLRRTLKVPQKNCKLIAYKSLVRPLEYASVVWSPHLANDKD
uniref:Rna-directed dna polymerase from mobile element jockey-like protein n=1 Tax=Rhipicephalus zambeziensis TaxID=60191 RepID=A0A224Z782_9ACAR